MFVLNLQQSSTVFGQSGDSNIFFIGFYSLSSFQQCLSRKFITCKRVFFQKSINFIPWLGDLMVRRFWKDANNFRHKLQVWFLPSKPQLETLHFRRKIRFWQRWSQALVQNSDSWNKTAKCVYHIEEYPDSKSFFFARHSLAWLLLSRSWSEIYRLRRKIPVKLYPFRFYVGIVVVATFQKTSILFYFFFETNNSPFLQTDKLGFLPQASKFQSTIFSSYNNFRFRK